MKFNKHLYKDELIGWSCKHTIAPNKFLSVFFGTKKSAEIPIDLAFPNLSFSRLSQVHGDDIVEAASDKLSTADSQYSSQDNLALSIVTADCLPVMIWSPTTNTIAAIHAGWRGVANEITIKTIKKICAQNLNSVQVFIGPHIHQESFEVGRDVAEIVTRNRLYIRPHFNPDKVYLSLSGVLIDQLTQLGIINKNIHEFKANTFTSAEYASFRRKENPVGRQVSFIALSSTS